MSLRIPSNRNEIFENLSSDVKSKLPTSNPQKKQSWIRAVLVGFAGAFYDLYLQIIEAINTFFVDTTYGVYLERKAAVYGMSRNAATQAEGYVAFAGTVGTVVPKDTIILNSGNQYKTQAAGTVISDVLNVSALTYASGIATAVTPSAHNLTEGMSVVIAGATPSGLNGTVTVKSVIAEDQFTYETSVVGSGTATGTITATSEKSVILIKSVETGADKNLIANEVLTLQTPIVNINNSALVVFSEVGGGEDIEDDDGLRDRLAYRLRNPVNLFNATHITLKALELSFVKRVFVNEITPEVGQVTIYFLKDNGEIPNSSEVSQVKDKIIDEIMPSNMSQADLIVEAPTPLAVNFTISGLSPDNTTMRQSIQNKLKEFFKNDVSVGDDIKRETYLCVIKSTIDSDTGAEVDDFNVDTPSGDIAVAVNEMPQYGSVSFV